MCLIRYLCYFQHNTLQFSSNNAWGTLLPTFDLPEESPEPLPNGSSSVAIMLQTFYNGILQPFEELYRKNVADQQRKARLINPGARPGPITSTSTAQSTAPNGTPQLFVSGNPTATSVDQTPQSQTSTVNGHAEGNSSDGESQGIKRKLEFDGTEDKRMRQKIGRCHQASHYCV
jgi:SWI/SNF chromatin-remodeling complex subunit SWI1